MKAPLYILIGGKSSRFGSPKPLHAVRGEPWARHVASGLGCDWSEVTLVAAAPSEWDTQLQARILCDDPHAQGPLAGAVAALQDRQAPGGEGLLVLASCDLVCPQPEWIEPLIAAHAVDPKLEVAAYRTAGRWEPFPSVIHSRWLPTLRTLLEHGSRSFQAAFDESSARAIPWTGSGDGPSQANTPAELAERLSALSGHSETDA